jgi:ABC-2 type transport system permease protein
MAERFKFFRDTMIVFEREAKDYWRWKLHFFFDAIYPMLDAILFLLIWGAILLGGFAGLGGLTKENYIGYILSGMVIWAFIGVTLRGDFVYGFVEEKHRRTIQYLFASPINRMAIPYGRTILPILRATYRALILVGLGLLFGFTFQGNILLAAFIILVTFLVFSGFGSIIAGLSTWREDLADLSWMFSYMIEISAGVYFPLQILPDNIRNILMILPQAQAVQAIRMVTLQNATFFDILPYTVPLIIIGIATAVVGRFVYKFIEKKAFLVGI